MVAPKLANVSEVSGSIVEQAKLTTKAAVEDMQTLISGERLDMPDNLKKPTWDDRFKTLTKDDGELAAASIARNIVILANMTPETAKELQSGVIAAKFLCCLLADGNSKETPIEKADNWLREAVYTLQVAAKNSNEICAEELADYIDWRMFEISEGLLQLREAERNGYKSQQL